MDDTITLHDIHAQCILGCYDDERRQKRDVSISVTLHTDIRQAAASDRLEDAIDYDALVQAILDTTEYSSFQLIESLAEHLAQLCLQETFATKVEVRVTKPNPRPRLAAATVAIERTRT